MKSYKKQTKMQTGFLSPVVNFIRIHICFSDLKKEAYCDEGLGQHRDIFHLHVGGIEWASEGWWWWGGALTLCGPILVN